MLNDFNIKIAIASGKGGTGKTLLATNLFYLLQQLDYNISLVDCDAEAPNDIVFFPSKLLFSQKVNQKVPVIDKSKCIFCGLCKDYCHYNAIICLESIKIINVVEELCHGCGACLVACNHSAIEEKDVELGSLQFYNDNNNSRIIEARMRVGAYSPVPVIKAAIKAAGKSGIILLDSPPGTSCPFIHTVSNADYIILLTEPTPFGLSDLKQSVETLKTINKPCGVIINRAGLGDNLVYNYLQEENIPLLMEIPFDKDIANHYSNGELFIKHKTEFKADIISMFHLILKEYGNSSY